MHAHKDRETFEVEKHSVHWSSCLCYVLFPCKLIAVTRPPTFFLAVWTYLLYHYTKPASCFLLFLSIISHVDMNNNLHCCLECLLVLSSRVDQRSGKYVCIIPIRNHRDVG